MEKCINKKGPENKNYNNYWFNKRFAKAKGTYEWLPTKRFRLKIIAALA
jgi:hypothetical protein